ncbi:unnamed protein product [Durusdinium trenchii]|uniref:Uncharacterized protein n=1 Tax=Durusdinium trenchii TaxID=1381693 RepID=A0ABP0INX7_9DINO
MARQSSRFFVCILTLWSCVGEEMEQQDRLNKLAQLLEDEGNNLKSMAAALHKESAAVEDAFSRQEEAAAMRAAASGASMLNVAGEALGSSVRGLRGSEPPAKRESVRLEALDSLDAQSFSDPNLQLDQTHATRRVGRQSTQVGTLSAEEKRLQDLLGLR